jgi:hypothetical protein
VVGDLADFFLSDRNVLIYTGEKFVVCVSDGVLSGFYIKI